LKWEPATNYKLTVRHKEVIPRRQLRWRWWRCWPLVALATAFVIFILTAILKAWLLNQTPEDIWRELYLISVWGR